MVLFRVWFICLLVVGVMFADWFVSSLVEGYVWYWVCLFVGFCLCDSIISFNSRDGVSVGLFYYRFKPIPRIVSYKWADYWPYLEFIYLIFFCVAFCCYVYYHGLFVSCFGWCGCWAFLFCAELLCFGRGI